MPDTFRMTRLVQFAETDMAGVMHFANYFRIMEEVEHAFWRSLGASVVSVTECADVSWPRVSVKCEYFAPLRFEDEVEVRLRVSEIGDKSMTYMVEFFKGSVKTAAGSAKAVCCQWGGGTFSPVAIPKTLRDKLQGR
ncbi:MAG: acyl-CoA thioesterase [Phycisphaerae bacterium]